MAIITLAETKDFLGIGSTESQHDDDINAQLPNIADRIGTICNRPFAIQLLRPYSTRRRDMDLYILSQVEAVFTADGVVTAKSENFATAQFAADQDLVIRGSYRNDGYYLVLTVSTSVLTIASTYSTGASAFLAEASGATIYFGVVDWPPGIKPLVASLIQFDYQDRGSWKDGDDGGFGVYGYPNRLLKDFQFYTKPRYGGTA